MNTLEMFSIENLFGEIDVSLKFDDRVSIYIGENGLGKTTILKILNYTLSLNFSELLSFNFTKIKIKFRNSATYELLKDDIVVRYLDNRSTKNRYYIESVLSSDDLEILLSMSNFVNIDDENYNYLLNKIAVKRNLPLAIAKFELDKFIKYISYHGSSGNPENVTLFRENIKKHIEDKEIIYYPTYRRIEENLTNLNLEQLDSFEGSLIQFGMDDVVKSINGTLVKIKNETIKNYNKLTGDLIGHYISEDTKVNDNEIPRIDNEKLQIILTRIGDQISTRIKKQLTKLINTKKHLENTNLNQLLFLLIKNYDSQKDLDDKIKDFVRVCNSYLINKSIFYDESKVSIQILKTSGKEINFSSLSSGEKQIISLFSKLYLKDLKDIIFIIDEPELSLSIRWQAKLLPDILNSCTNIQVITVTHSPFIFDNELKEKAILMRNSVKYDGR